MNISSIQHYLQDDVPEDADEDSKSTASAKKKPAPPPQKEKKEKQTTVTSPQKKQKSPEKKAPPPPVARLESVEELADDTDAASTNPFDEDLKLRAALYASPRVRLRVLPF